MEWWPSHVRDVIYRKLHLLSGWRGLPGISTLVVTRSAIRIISGYWSDNHFSSYLGEARESYLTYLPSSTISSLRLRKFGTDRIE